MEKIKYEDLNSKQKENYNFQKASAILADYGYTTIKLSDDWEGADFIAIHYLGEDFLKVQLKGRLTFAKKYFDKNIKICFEDKLSQNWYLYDHDALYKKLSKRRFFENTTSWIRDKFYSFNKLNELDILDLSEYKL